MDTRSSWTRRNISARTRPIPPCACGGNDLACQSCHLNAGLQPFAAPFVSTFATFPMLVDDQVLTLKERINGCMTRSMNGKPLPDDGREMRGADRLYRIRRHWQSGRRARSRHGTETLTRTDGTTRHASRRSGLCQVLRQLPQGRRARGEAPAAACRLHHPAALGRRQLQCRRRHGQDSTTPPPISTTTCLSASITRIRF